MTPIALVISVPHVPVNASCGRFSTKNKMKKIIMNNAKNRVTIK